MRNSILFMGNGEYSLADCYLLHKELDRALTLLSGIQQPPHSDSVEQRIENIKQTEDAKEELNTIVNDIVMALTGKKYIYR
jgi:predicted nucleic acid-binding OB-fold protein